MSAPKSTDTPEGPPSRPSTRRNNDGVLLPATMEGGGRRGNADGPQTLSAARPPRSARRSASSRPLGSAPPHKVIYDALIAISGNVLNTKHCSYHRMLEIKTMNTHIDNLPKASSKERIPVLPFAFVKRLIIFILGLIITLRALLLLLPSGYINNLVANNWNQESENLNPRVQMKKNFIIFDDDHNHNHSSLPKECIRDVTPILFDEWRKSNETICTQNDMSVQKFTMKRWEYEPAFLVYQNVFLHSFYGSDHQYTCQNLTRKTIEYRGAPNESDAQIVAWESINQPVIRVTPFDPNNAYERFHAYLNVAFAMAMFNLTNPQIVYVAPGGTSEIPRGEIEMYESFSPLKPIIVPHPRNETTSKIIFVPYMIDSSPSGTSILVTNTGGALRGRGTDHHCKSSIFRGILRWMKSNLLGDYIPSKDQNGNAETIQIVWSTRQQYLRITVGQVYMPSRSIVNEDELIHLVGQTLGSKYNITAVNFGTLTTHESVKIASQSHIMVGVHGAGLMWSAFLRSDPHAGLLEMFGGDRSSVNRHYHNIASLADIHYRSLSLNRKPGDSKALAWDQPTIDNIVAKIRSIDLHQEP